MKVTITPKDYEYLAHRLGLAKDTEFVFITNSPESQLQSYLSDTAAEIRAAFLGQPGKLHAIKLAREVFDLGLKDAKDLIDSMPGWRNRP